MADFYTAKQLVEIMDSHKRALDGSSAAVQNLADLGERAVQLWAQAEALVEADEAAAATTKKQTDVFARWDTARPLLSKALDALAHGAGVTRQAILDQLAAEPATDFGV